MLREGLYMWTWKDPPEPDGWVLVLHSEREYGMRGFFWFKAQTDLKEGLAISQTHASQLKLSLQATTDAVQDQKE